MRSDVASIASGQVVAIRLVVQPAGTSAAAGVKTTLVPLRLACSASVEPPADGVAASLPAAPSTARSYGGAARAGDAAASASSTLAAIAAQHGTWGCARHAGHVTSFVVFGGRQRRTTGGVVPRICESCT